LRRQQLDDSFAANTREWRAQWEELDRYARRNGAKIEGLLQAPTANEDEFSRAFVLIAEHSTWTPLPDLLTRLRGRAAELAALAVPNIESTADELVHQLQRLNEEVDAVNVQRIEVHNRRQLKAADIGSLRRRIKSLTNDLQKNQDVQKLQRYSGQIADLTPDRCPTCEQSLVDTLLSQEALTAVMPIEDNIEYIKSQLRMFEDILAREEEEWRSLEHEIANMDRELADSYSRIRTLRSDLVSPGSNPSAAAVEERLRTENRIRELEGIQAVFEEAVDRMKLLSATYANLLIERAALPSDKMSPSDRRKLDELSELLRGQAAE